MKFFGMVIYDGKAFKFKKNILHMVNKKAKADVIILSLDVVGFALIFLGAGLIRLARDEIISILGGFVLAGGVVLLSITRLIHK